MASVTKSSKQLFQLGLAWVLLSLFSVSAFAGTRMVTLEVTLTNVTRGTVLTPPIVASTLGPVSIFAVGEPASTALEQMAEGGGDGTFGGGFLYDSRLTSV